MQMTYNLPLPVTLNRGNFISFYIFIRYADLFKRSQSLMGAPESEEEAQTPINLSNMATPEAIPTSAFHYINIYVFLFFL